MRLPHVILGSIFAAALGIAIFYDTPKSETAFDPQFHAALRADWDQRIHITYWEKWGGFERDACQEMVNDFNASQNRIVVHYVKLGSKVSEKGMLSILSGRPPDVIGLWDYDLCPFAEAGGLEPLDDWMASAKISPDRYPDSILRLCRYGGKTYALPTAPSAVALHYNLDHFNARAKELRAAGLDPNRAPRTIPELDAYARALDVFDPTGRPIVMGFLPTEPGWFNWTFGHYFDGKLYDPARHAVTPDDPANVEAFLWAKRYALRYGTDAVKGFKSTFGGFDSPQNAFIDGRVSMELQGVWFANFVRRHRPDFNLGVAPFPVAAGVNGPRSSIETDLIAIPRGCRHPAEAREFLRYVQHRGMTILCRGQGKHLPLRAREYPSDFFLGHKNPVIQTFVEIADSPFNFTRPPIGIWNEYKDEYGKAFDRVWNHVPDRKLAGAGGTDEYWRGFIRTELAAVRKKIQARLDHETDRLRKDAPRDP